MEMEMGMDSLSFYQHLNPPPPSSGGQVFSYYCHYPPYTAAAAMANNSRRDGDFSLPPPPPARQRQRSARKDRPSKICTAGGMRDRRVRLSLVVARRFFSLQDKLGFDKASKTVQWLLDMSTAGINHLLATSATSMSKSEEDGSGSVLLDSNDAPAETNNCKMPTKARRRAGRKSSNGAPTLLSDKESRARARQRARERTAERNRLRASVPTVTMEAPAQVRQVILPVIPSSFDSYCEEQEPWELWEELFVPNYAFITDE